MRNRNQELLEILVGLIGDLTISVSLIREYESKPYMHKPELKTSRQCIWRLCFNSIVLNCCKYVELNRKYSREFNEMTNELNQLRGQFNEQITSNKSLLILRDDYVAHVNSKKTKKSLTPSEVQEHIITMIGGSTNAAKFLDWVCPDSFEASNPNESLVGVVTQLRDLLASKL
ncbi:hypothetical protein BZG00_05615 [Salinivibrio kushneri]|uniref:HEPN AbiU2-like domain-containing protein n=2 Tax=Salinivibrio kushneri TaxID=1908198 RepID=A0AB36JYT7_9GAMM|nr:hypothetical protein BZG00_05615 [Salinivibrio kushneri]QCP01270.1 hypothetical protein FCN78_01965 [Salinivibrio kushneri]